MMQRKRARFGMYLIIAAMLVAGAACSAPAAPPEPLAVPSVGDTEPSVEPQGVPAEPAGMVEVAYFHTERRCGPCTYIEIRTQHNVETYFQEELASGKLVFNSYELGLQENTAVATKYQAVGSQLFINTIIDGKDNIQHIEAVWDKEYLDDQEKFDALIQDLVSQALQAVG